tara:strand:+ start:100 stop:870 length:771 start_codon:yes stop_codon:yes gene_type:complete
LEVLINKEEFKGKVVLVTGASRGIGKAIAIELAKCGASVAINYNSNTRLAKITLKRVKSYGVNAEIIKANVSEEKEVKYLIREAEQKLGPIDLLVTNAGILHLPKDALDLNYKIWKKIMSTNVDGTLLPIKEVIPGMIKRKFGRIVCISSIAGLGKRPNMITYATSKASVIALARNLAEAVAPYIRINTVAPGLIETDMAKAFSKEAKKNIILNTPLKRLGTSEDIANTVIYLLSEQSSFITGQTLIVDGGKVVLP